MAGIWHCCVVGHNCSSESTTGWGTFICHRCDCKKRKKKGNENALSGIKKKNQKTKFIDTENRLVVARGVEYKVSKMDEGGQKVQTSSYKINMS